MTQNGNIVKASKGEAYANNRGESEGQQHITFDDVIRDLYEKFHQAVQELDRERSLGA
jgi:hypothetical protein